MDDLKIMKYTVKKVYLIDLINKALKSIDDDAEKTAKVFRYIYDNSYIRKFPYFKKESLPLDLLDEKYGGLSNKNLFKKSYWREERTTFNEILTNLDKHEHELIDIGHDILHTIIKWSEGKVTRIRMNVYYFERFIKNNLSNVTVADSEDFILNNGWSYR